MKSSNSLLPPHTVTDTQALWAVCAPSSACSFRAVSSPNRTHLFLEMWVFHLYTRATPYNLPTCTPEAESPPLSHIAHLSRGLPPCPCTCCTPNWHWAGGSVAAPVTQWGGCSSRHGGGCGAGGVVSQLSVVRLW